MEGRPSHGVGPYSSAEVMDQDAVSRHAPEFPQETDRLRRLHMVQNLGRQYEAEAVRRERQLQRVAALQGNLWVIGARLSGHGKGPGVSIQRRDLDGLSPSPGPTDDDARDVRV